MCLHQANPGAWGMEWKLMLGAIQLKEEIKHV